MEAGDANFVVSATVAGSTGATIIGSETAGNVLGGLIGNDTFTSSKNAAVGDTIYTGGGADKVALTVGNGVDRVELFSAFGSGGINPGESAIPRFNSIANFERCSAVGMVGAGNRQLRRTGYTAGARSMLALTPARVPT